MTVPARPGLEPLVLTDLPAALARLELLPVPQLGAAVYEIQRLLREGKTWLALARYGLAADELALLRFHWLADEWRAAAARDQRRDLARELARHKGPRTTFAAHTHPTDEDAA